MRLVMGGINGHYLRNITENYAHDTEEVLAAVAYATHASLLFDWCWKHRIPLKFYGRLDDTIPVTVRILETFLSKRSANFVCRLVQHHHAKVIWWRGVGAYIGSANLTDSAWYKNIEAGCFFTLPLSLRLIRSAATWRRRGKFRRSQNWIGPPGCGLNDARYVGP